MTATPALPILPGLRLVCAGCGWTPPDAGIPRYPFRCPNAGTDDLDHVVTRQLKAVHVMTRQRDGDRVAVAPVDDPNPFIRHRELFTAWHAAHTIGMTDAAYVDLVRALDAKVAAVDGHGFRVTPFTRAQTLSERLDLDVW
ncbi:MAG: hypothetical protein C0497_10960, partial [Gemmatimonas sp.]|nr:hypothetical protein [Gemmatimonas sp.]